MFESNPLSAVAELPGAVGAVVAMQDGGLRAAIGVVGNGDALAASSAVMTGELLGLGNLLRLGEFATASVKAPSVGRVFARRGAAVLAVAFDPRTSLGGMELKLRDIAWLPDPAIESPAVNRVSTVKIKARVRGSTLPPRRPRTIPTPPSVMPPPRAVGTEPASPPVTTAVSGSMNALATGQVFEGALDEFSMPDLLELLRSSQRSGLLICTSGAATGTVQLSRGMIVCANSPAALDIRVQLLSIPGISPQQRAALTALPATAFDEATVVGELASRGLVSPDTVERACVARINSALREMIGWTEGRFSFDPTEAPGNSVPRALNAQSLLMRIFQEPSASP
jgi:predicted regulator of Ras-like GTPase activity (Roadblock/LC7/MglB family)